MTKRNEIYRCMVCGNVVEVASPAAGTLSCCGQPMRLMRENTTDGAKEKHVPVVERVEGGFRVSVGSVEHPMLDNHYIQWIELFDGDTLTRRYLKPGDKPEAVFRTDSEEVYAREYCNLHGNWRSE